MRKLGLIITFWIGLLAFPLSGLALGLGEIQVDSYLNQPLKAEIPVVSARPGEIDDLLVSLASRDSFRRAGLERPAILSKLRFKVNKSEDGNTATIYITTKKPVKEPFLNFLVEADWAKGRLLREYTILLDPPVFAQQSRAVTPRPAAPVAPAPAPTPVAEPAAPAPIATQEPAPAPAADTGNEIAYVPDTAYENDQATQPATAAAPEAGQVIRVQKGDTLWGIAAGLKDGEHSMAQIMLALQQANPDAFGQNNINNLKVGAVLRVPDREAFNTFSKQEAYAQVLEQNGLWDEYLARVSGKSTTAQPQNTGDMAAAAASDQQPADSMAEGGQLNLLAPGDGNSDTASLKGDNTVNEDIARLRKQLALAEEELDAARLENSNLQSRVQDLVQQLKKYEELQQKLMQVEDPALAQLQQNAARSDQMAVTAEAEKQPAPSDAMDTTDGMNGDMAAETAPAETMPAETPAMADQGMEAGAPADGMLPETDAPAMPMNADGQQAAEMPQDAMPMDGQDGLATAEPQPEETMPANGMTSPEETAAETMPAPAAEEVPPPAPVIVSESPQPGGEGGLLDMLPSMDGLLGDPIMLGGVGAILALLLGLLFVRRKKSDDDDDVGITLDVPDSASGDDQTPIHIPESDATPEESTQIEMPSEDDLSKTEMTLQGDTTDLEVKTEEYNAEELLGEVSLDDGADEFQQTAVLDADEMPQAEDTEEQDDVLNEVDVYLAYGLYDNAEELLKTSLDEHPTRADYRAKLLDTYYAMKNKDAFVEEARALHSLGGAADRFWDRVKVMGHELAPEEELFQGAENIDPEAVKIEYEKPQSADFDLSEEADVTDFATDFDIGEEGEDIADTLVVPEAPEEAENKSADVDLSLDDDLGLGDEDALNFELPDELDEDAIETLEDISELDLEETETAPIPGEIPPLSDDAMDLEIDEDATDLRAVESELSDHAEELDAELPDSLDVDVDLEDEVPDLQPEEGELMAGTSEVEAVADQHVKEEMGIEVSGDGDEVFDLSDDDITEFRPADMAGEFELPDTAEAVASSTVDDKTGTFAPGDFDDEFGASNVADDIEDLMLPDDVDEVATKLDLAKAFIDMGDAEGARSSLQEVLEEGNDEQKAEATDLLNQIK